MKKSLITALSFLLPGYLLFAQDFTLSSSNSILIGSPEAICTLHVDELNEGHKVAPVSSHKKGSHATATFSVEFLDQDEQDPWPQDAKDAFEAGLAIWASHIASSINIEVEATWYDFGGCGNGGFILGSAGPRLLLSNFTNAPNDSLFFPISMANALAESDLVPSLPDITARFNKDCGVADADRWYYGTDGEVPSGKIDFVSVVLHEIGHGLGFVGSANLDDGNSSNGDECNSGTDGHGCLGDFIYDLFAVDAQEEGEKLLDTEFYENDSILLGNRLAGENAGVFFEGTSSNFANEGVAPRLYTPSNWSSGSSYSHLDNSTFDGTSHALMTSSISSGESALTPGAIVCGMFGDMGWPLGNDCLGQLPVELTVFEGRADGDRIKLEWKTASETNNAGFELYHLPPGGSYRHIDFVAGQGTTSESNSYAYELAQMPPGLHKFKLRQVDFDGTHSWSDELALPINLDGVFRVSEAYPNPFNPTTKLTFAVNRAQPVRAAVVDALGRTVRVLLNEEIQAHSEYELTFDAGSLSSGSYWILVEGAYFHASKPVLLVK